jgi:hypothetical protein
LFDIGRSKSGPDSARAPDASIALAAIKMLSVDFILLFLS